MQVEEQHFDSILLNFLLIEPSKDIIFYLLQTIMLWPQQNLMYVNTLYPLKSHLNYSSLFILRKPKLVSFLYPVSRQQLSHSMRLMKSVSITALYPSKRLKKPKIIKKPKSICTWEEKVPDIWHQTLQYWIQFNFNDEMLKHENVTNYGK